MTPAQLRATLTFLGLDVAEASRVLGVTTRAVRMWLQPPDTATSRPIPAHVDRMLDLLLRLKRAGLWDAKQAMADFAPEWPGSADGC